MTSDGDKTSNPARQDPPQNLRDAQIAHPHEVRAGPGDAGASDRPVPLPEAPERRGRGRRAIVLFAILVIAAVLIIGVFNRAALP